MKDSVISVERGGGLRKRCKLSPLAAIGLTMAMAAGSVGANGLGENPSWQFQTTQDKVNKSAVLDQIEKKKGGYYDAIKSTYNYNTYIDRQVNCSVSAGTTANSGSNATTASTSSPTVSNAGTTSSDTAANSASNGVAQSGLNGVLVTGSGTPTPAGTVDNAQNNSGALSSGVSGSNTSAATGAVTAGAGTTDQALNSQQSNTGALTASISSSTACNGMLN